MIPGLNSELRRKGRTVHIQTEARTTPLTIVTEVFVRGSVVFSQRTQIPDGSTHAEMRQMLSQIHRQMHASIARGDVDERLLTRVPSSSDGIPLARAQVVQGEPEKV